MQIRRATLDDLDAIIDLTRPYFDESFYAEYMTYSELGCRRSFAKMIRESNVFLVDADGLVAMAAVRITNTFYVQAEADLEFFYVMPEYRGTGIARFLTEICTDFAKRSGARVMYALSGSGMEGKNDKLWVNLWKKNGFDVLGTTMIGVL
jgi:GNAT superfamily N-acetyltransferase